MPEKMRSESEHTPSANSGSLYYEFICERCHRVAMIVEAVVAELKIEDLVCSKCDAKLVSRLEVKCAACRSHAENLWNRQGLSGQDVMIWLHGEPTADGCVAWKVECAER